MVMNRISNSQTYCIINTMTKKIRAQTIKLIIKITGKMKTREIQAGHGNESKAKAKITEIVKEI